MDIIDLKTEINEQCIQIALSFDEIKKLYENSPLLPAIIEKFAETKDKSKTLIYAVTLTNAEQAKSEKTVVTVQPCETETEVISGTFRVSGTKSQIIALRDFMKSLGVKFEVVK
jgi:hypothetical protein